VSCTKQSPTAPDSNPGPTKEISGTERIGWDQAADSPEHLAMLRFMIYVDNQRRDLSDFACDGNAGANNHYPCSARLPSLTPGPHTLALVSSVLGQPNLESPQSHPLSVVVANRTSSEAGVAAESSTTPVVH
jgi:hypothetical protein